MMTEEKTLLAAIREFRYDRKHQIWSYRWYSDNSVFIAKNDGEETETRQFDELSKRAQKSLTADRARREKTDEFLKQIGKL
jgi:hypothetical protein